MTIAQRHKDFNHISSQEISAKVMVVLDQLAEKRQQSCQLATRHENAFRVIFQGTPSDSFYVTMPIGLTYQAPMVGDGLLRESDEVAQQPNPALPDVMDFYVPIFQGAEQVALLIAPHIKHSGAPAPDTCEDDLIDAAKRLSSLFATRAFTLNFPQDLY